MRAVRVIESFDCTLVRRSARSTGTTSSLLQMRAELEIPNLQLVKITVVDRYDIGYPTIRVESMVGFAQGEVWHRLVESIGHLTDLQRLVIHLTKQRDFKPGILLIITLYPPYNRRSKISELLKTLLVNTNGTQNPLRVQVDYFRLCLAAKSRLYRNQSDVSEPLLN